MPVISGSLRPWQAHVHVVGGGERGTFDPATFHGAKFVLSYVIADRFGK
jgi:hypothetical protein